MAPGKYEGSVRPVVYEPEGDPTMVTSKLPTARTLEGFLIGPSSNSKMRVSVYPVACAKSI